MMAAALMTLGAGCVIGIRSNMSFSEHKLEASTSGVATDSSRDERGNPAVNADATKTFSDMLKNNGNNNGSTIEKAESEASK